MKKGWIATFTLLAICATIIGMACKKWADSDDEIVVPHVMTPSCNHGRPRRTLEFYSFETLPPPSDVMRTPYLPTCKESAQDAPMDVQEIGDWLEHRGCKFVPQGDKTVLVVASPSCEGFLATM